MLSNDHFVSKLVLVIEKRVSTFLPKVSGGRILKDVKLALGCDRPPFLFPPGLLVPNTLSQLGTLPGWA